ncbi:Arc/MetJ family transcription regulator [Spinactinospora alkalitolerans]|uniref:Arc/MetJ family transcription regulator n=1 Tax=Spinactinospora alkalitolerans TaxID=687207 RepID=A0A852TWI3_9ACTN|nr:hypothetical protein [Spinactinospora alkalitolerans]NYE46434.1 Arc/MetJ family transcription regulator [Spinactinospora alkalitolerans]
MTEILIDGIDAETPACAAEILGTRTAEDTVDAALRETVRRPGGVDALALKHASPKENPC